MASSFLGLSLEEEGFDTVVNQLYSAMFLYFDLF